MEKRQYILHYALQKQEKMFAMFWWMQKDTNYQYQNLTL